MAGIYIHVPFCKQACHYCNFHFSTSLKLKNDFLQGLLKEIPFRKEYLSGEEINTIYFGGGTPSLLDAAELDQVFSALHRNFRVNAAAEISFEANPDDISNSVTRDWKSLGINRLSMGVQSFYEEDLRWMNRAHSAGQAEDSVKLVQDAGFHNLTIDLIYGSPGLSDEKWENNLRRALALQIPHLSCYAMTVEEKTALDLMIKKKKSPPVHTEDQARQFLLLMDWLAEAGFEHYEISNFALPGMHSRHNSAYWSGDSYLGLGPSAHSYNGKSRQWNIANNVKYIKALSENRLESEEEILTPENVHNEYVMVQIRKKEGIRIADYIERFGVAAYQQLEKNLRGISLDKIVVSGENISLTKEGKLFADGIAAELFV